MADLTFMPGSDECTAFVGWWSALSQDRGGRANLRRCSSVDEAMQERSVVYLCLKLGVGGADYIRDRVGMMALLAARATHRPGSHPAAAFAKPKSGSVGGGPVVSELRFRRLLGAEDRDEFLPLLRRAITLAGGEVDLESLAQSIWFWIERTRREWADQYYRLATLKN